MLKSLHGNVHLLVDVRFVVSEVPYARCLLSAREHEQQDRWREQNDDEDEGSATSEAEAD